MEINLKEWQCYARGLGSKTCYHQSFVLRSLLEAAITSLSFSTHGQSFGFPSLQSKWKQMFMQTPGLKCNDMISSKYSFPLTLWVTVQFTRSSNRSWDRQSMKNNNEKGRLNFILLCEEPGAEKLADFPGGSCLEDFEKTRIHRGTGCVLTEQLKRKALPSLFPVKYNSFST